MATQTNNELFVAWFNDAFAMEQAFIEAQENQIEPTKGHPALQSGIATVAGKLQGMSTMFAKDKAVKIGINNHAVEYIEIASYKALIQAAEQLGHTTIAERCRGILAQEEAMSAKIDDLLPMLVDEALATGSY